MAGGFKFTPGTTSDYGAETEEYDGTSWTSVNSQFPGTTNGQGGLQKCRQTDFRVFSPTPTAGTNCQKYYESDGTNWAAGTTIGTARFYGGGSGSGTQTCCFNDRW